MSKCYLTMKTYEYAWITINLQILVTNPSLIPRKLTGIAGQYFLYRKSNQSDFLRKGLNINEGEDG
jgi:hypothetical protein